MLDWNRVCEIAAYLLQSEISTAPEKIDKYFKDFYADGAARWPPAIRSTIKYKPSVYPSVPNVLIHTNGARLELEQVNGTQPDKEGHQARNGKAQHAYELVIEKKDPKLSVIDGQHRINGAYLALRIRQETDANASLDVPATVFLNLDAAEQPPRNQAQIFINVNFYQKKVDRSLVVDLFPTAKGSVPVTETERAQDIGRRLMLEVGHLPT